MILSDSPSNTEFLYVYVNKFKWERPLENEQNGGHPIAGRVYRAARNKDTGSHRLFHSEKYPPTLLVFSSLKESIPESHTSDIEVLTKGNLLDYNITDEDLDSLIGWLKTDNADMKKTLGFLAEEAPNAVSALTQFIKSNEEIDDFIRIAHKLYEVNPNLLNAIHDYLHFAVENELSINEGPFTTMMLTLDKHHSTGANLVKAVEKISRYASSNRRVNKDPDDLMSAITDLFNEQISLIINS